MLIELYELLEEPPLEVELSINKRENPKQAARKVTEFLEFERVQLQQAKNPYEALNSPLFFPILTQNILLKSKVLSSYEFIP